MEKAKRARKAETPKQPSLCLRLRAPYLYPDQSGTRGPGASRCGNCFSAGVQHLIVWHPRRSGGHVRRREFITLLSGAAVGWPVAANAQQAAKIARIGWLGVHLAPNPQAREAFRQGLRELGYVEGRNLVIEYRDAEGKFDRFPALAAELVALKVDVIVAPNTVNALAAKQATRTIPIVFATVSDPVGSGLVTGLARPGGNVTGLCTFAPELVSKCLQLLTQAVPGLSRVAALWAPGTDIKHIEKDMLKGAEVAARALGVRLQFVEARGPEDFDRAFSDMTSAGVGAVTMLPSLMLLNERRRLVDLAARTGCRPCTLRGRLSMPGAL